LATRETVIERVCSFTLSFLKRRNKLLIDRDWDGVNS
jgi:hypothetical protein